MLVEISARVTSTGACLLATSIEAEGSLVTAFEFVVSSIITCERWLHIHVDGKKSFVVVEIRIVPVKSKETGSGLFIQIRVD
jgi:hypothetical protein